MQLVRRGSSWLLFFLKSALSGRRYKNEREFLMLVIVFIVIAVLHALNVVSQSLQLVLRVYCVLL